MEIAHVYVLKIAHQFPLSTGGLSLQSLQSGYCSSLVNGCGLAQYTHIGSCLAL